MQKKKEVSMFFVSLYEKLLAFLLFYFSAIGCFFMFFPLLFSYQSKKHGGFPFISFVVNAFSQLMTGR